MLQDARRGDALPRGRELDEHAPAVDAASLVERDEAVRARHAGGGVEAQARVDLGRDTPGHDLQDLETEAHQHLVDDGVLRLAPVRLHGGRKQRCVGRHAHGFQNERRVGGGVARGVLRELLEVAAVGDDGRELLELVELVHGMRWMGWRLCNLVDGKRRV